MKLSGWIAAPLLATFAFQAQAADTLIRAAADAEKEIAALTAMTDAQLVTGADAFWMLVGQTPLSADFGQSVYGEDGIYVSGTQDLYLAFVITAGSAGTSPSVAEWMGGKRLATTALLPPVSFPESLSSLRGTPVITMPRRVKAPTGGATKVADELHACKLRASGNLFCAVVMAANPALDPAALPENVRRSNGKVFLYREFKRVANATLLGSFADSQTEFNSLTGAQATLEQLTAGTGTWVVAGVSTLNSEIGKSAYVEGGIPYSGSDPTPFMSVVFSKKSDTSYWFKLSVNGKVYNEGTTIPGPNVPDFMIPVKVAAPSGNLATIGFNFHSCRVRANGHLLCSVTNQISPSAEPSLITDAARKYNGQIVSYRELIRR